MASLPRADPATTDAAMAKLPRSQRSRLDLLLVERGLAQTREKAQALILADAVRVAGRPARGAAEPVARDAELVVRAADGFASRGGTKLEHGLERFGIRVADLVWLDAGASTGGFTDALLRRGARRVYAVDVGHGQLDWGLRNDPRVVVRERTNIRHLDALPELVDGAVADLSFISLRLALPTIGRLTRPGASIVALVKPQFEAGRGHVGRGGVVRDPAVWRRVLLELWDWSAEQSLTPRGLTASPLRGPAGNVEFLLWLINGAASGERRAVTGEQTVHSAIAEAPGSETRGGPRTIPGSPLAPDHSPRGAP